MNTPQSSTEPSNKVFFDISTKHFCIPLPEEPGNQGERKFLFGTLVLQRHIPFDPSRPPIFIEEKIFCKTIALFYPLTRIFVSYCDNEAWSSNGDV